MSQSYVKGLREELLFANRELIACEASHDEWKARAEKAEAECERLAGNALHERTLRLKVEAELKAERKDSDDVAQSLNAALKIAVDARLKAEAELADAYAAIREIDPNALMARAHKAEAEVGAAEQGIIAWQQRALTEEAARLKAEAECARLEAVLQLDHWAMNSQKAEEALREADAAFSAVLAEDGHGYKVAPMGWLLRQQAEAAHTAIRSALSEKAQS